ARRGGVRGDRARRAQRGARDRRSLRHAPVRRDVRGCDGKGRPEGPRQGKRDGERPVRHVAREYRRRPEGRRRRAPPRVSHARAAAHGAAAEWEGDRLTVWESTQGIFRVRENLAKALGIALSNVRVIKDYMGGGFGAKNSAGPHTYTAALFAKRLGRPVRCINDREAEQTDSGNRPASTQRVTIGAKKDGTLTAIHASIDIPLGITGYEGGPGQIYHEMYACP